MINIFLKNKLSPIARMSIILINDILLLNFSLYFSYYLRIEYFLQIFLIKNVLVISTIFYLILFFSFKIYKQYLDTLTITHINFILIFLYPTVLYLEFMCYYKMIILFQDLLY